MALLATAGWEGEDMAASEELICYATPCVNSRSWQRITERATRQSLTETARPGSIEDAFVRLSAVIFLVLTNL